ncbi:MAG: ATP-grasp domain-containing protein [Clostridium sp.]|uniref:ATP-grasp domain-containing protein n=1 Tax=Clostridium sp. TaxID=1506 RepID=UPI003D6CC76E
MKKKVLVFPCGSVTAVDINFALRNCLRVELYGASSIDDHGEYVYKNYIGGVPNISDCDFIEKFNRILINKAIDFIIPTHDTVALYLKENEKKIFSTVICADLETTKICRYKSLTYKLFSEYDFTPNIYTNLTNVNQYPVFLKPDDGQGGKGAFITHNEEETKFYMERNNKMIICEYLPGDEITIDCFTDKNLNLRVVCERTRERTFGGISVKANIVKLEEEVKNISQIINSKLKFRGYWYFQLKKNSNNKYKLMEISTRMAGTSCISRNLDINFPLLSILDFNNEDIDILPNNYNIEVDRTLINRYKIDINYERVYLDFDDTLVFDKKIYNQYMFFYLYQCLNNNKEIILITKHNVDIINTLNRLKIPESLFNKIIKIDASEYKYEYMDNSIQSIFIDNSFKERKMVKEKLCMPTFDTGNIECLIDWRG